MAALAILCDSDEEVWAPGPQKVAPDQIAAADCCSPCARGEVGRDNNETAPPSVETIDRLRQWVIPPLVEGWRRRGIVRLLPLQVRALGATRLMERGNVVVCGPGSAGKTMVGEMALAAVLSEGWKGLYLLPTRALAEEKAAEFRRWLAPAGMNVACAVGGPAGESASVARNDFHLLVAVYEKLHHLLLSRPHLLVGVGAVVVDEAQMLADPARGGTLDLLLTRLREAACSPQIVALAAPLADPAPLANWLGAQAVVERRRPRDLHEGVLDLESAEFSFRSLNSGDFGCERLAAASKLHEAVEALADVRREQTGVEAAADRAAPRLFPGDHRAIAFMDAEACGLLAAAAVMADRGERSLVFAPTRRAAAVWALWLSAARRLSSDSGAACTASQPPPHPKASSCGAECLRLEAMLNQCAEAGVGFHHALLGVRLRRRVESDFKAGRTRILIATPTLGMGVNLHADNVLQSSWMIGDSAADRSAALRPIRPLPSRRRLDRDRFRNQGGRAARIGMGSGPGRSMLVAPTPQLAARVWDEILLAPEPELRSSGVISMDPARACLIALAGAWQPTAREIHRLLSGTFAAFDARTASASCLEAATHAPASPADAARLAPAFTPDGANPPAAHRPDAATHYAPTEGPARLQPDACASPIIDDSFSPSAVTAALGDLEENKLARRCGPDRWQLTAAGETAAGFGLRVETVATLLELAADLAAAEPRSIRLDSLIMRIAAIDEADAELRGLGFPEPKRPAPRLIDMDRTRCFASPLGAADANRSPLSGEPRACFVASVLSEFSAGADALWLEENCALDLEQILAAGEVVSRYLFALARLIPTPATSARQSETASAPTEPEHAADAPTEPDHAAHVVRQLTNFAHRVQRGLPAASLALSGLTDRPDDRPLILALAREGWESVGALADIDDACLRRLPDAERARQLQRKARRLIECDRIEQSRIEPDRRISMPSTDSVPAAPAPLLKTHFTDLPPTAAVLLEIDTASPGIVRLSGNEVRLPPLSFTLLVALAERPGQVVSRNALYFRLWPGGGPEDQQLDSHRRVLDRRLAPHLNRSPRIPIEVVRGSGFRLNLHPDQVRLSGEPS